MVCKHNIILLILLQSAQKGQNRTKMFQKKKMHREIAIPCKVRREKAMTFGLWVLHLTGQKKINNAGALIGWNILKTYSKTELLRITYKFLSYSLWSPLPRLHE